MLTTIARAAAIALLAVGALTAAPATATADTRCTERFDETTGLVIIDCSNTRPGGGGGNNAGGGGGGGEDTTTCQHAGQTIPCETVAGTWNGSCYVRLADPQPDFDDDAWGGNTDGYIIECTPYACVNLGGVFADCPGIQRYWAASAPDAGPSPRELADRAVAAMQLTMGEIGSTPPSTDIKADSMGIVGIPIWLWVANPADNTTGPITRSESGGSITVTATGRLDRIEWTFTDRQTGAVRHQITCAGDNARGTPWTESVGGDGHRPSPTCGLPGPNNDKVGHFNLTGTAHWVVEWAGGGQSGTITVPGQTRTVPIDIGELQVITVR